MDDIIDKINIRNLKYISNINTIIGKIKLKMITKKILKKYQKKIKLKV